MKPITYSEPDSLRGVIDALSEGAHLIAGGSDLLGVLKEGIESPDRLVSLGGVHSLRAIEPFEGGLRIGALVTIHELETAEALTGPYGMLAEAARSVATPEIRHQGTLGGNLAQRPRCLHYRSALVSCFKKGGDSCPAAESPYQNYLSLFGGPNRFGVHASDLAPPLIALGAEVVIEGKQGKRRLPLADFFTGPELDATRETVLGAGDVITNVILPSMPNAWRGLYTKCRERTAGDFPIVSGAIGYEMTDGRMRGVRVVLGGVAPTPFRSLRAEILLEGQPPSEELAKRAADAALDGAAPLSHNAFKVDLAHALIWRAVMRLSANT
jgi:xanthine dehydrogenase YagS FAD-binding subunit